MTSEIKTIETKRQVSSLCWKGENLIDFADGGSIYQLEGEELRSRYFNAYKFDAAIISPSGQFGVAYEKRGTKGVVFHKDKIIREINRSFYSAQVYEYPVALFQLADRREVIVHCPDEYNKLEMDELETGKRLTQREGEPKDFFHSRLTASEDGKYLMSAGWIWHPYDWVEIYNLEQVLKNPSLLDESPSYFDSSAEINNACFLSNDELLLCSEAGAEDFDEGEPEEERRSPMRPGTFGFVDLIAKKLTKTVPILVKMGTMFALDDKHVLGVYEHPKVVNIENGEIVQQWPQLKTGKQNSSIIHCIEKIPPMSFDKANRRFAVADEKNIHVLTIPRYDR